MTVGSAFLLGLVLGLIIAAVGFVWLNRNKPEQLDAAEGKVRDFKKP